VKLCKTCSVEKPESDYYKDGPWLRGSCKDCVKAKRKDYVEANKEEVLQASREYYRENVEVLRQKQKAYYEAKREVLRQKQSEYYRSNKPKFLAQNSAARAALYQATPKHLTVYQKKQIESIYAERDRLSVETGEQYHVDHIIPLRGKYICGLHTPENLRVITAQDNLTKGNRYDQ